MLLLAHLSLMLIGELVVSPWSVVRLLSVSPPFSKIIFSKNAGPIKAKFHMEPQWDRVTNVCLWGLGHMTKMATMPYMLKTLQKSSSLEHHLVA